MKLTRRDFIKGTAAVAGMALAMPVMAGINVGRKVYGTGFVAKYDSDYIFSMAIRRVRNIATLTIYEKERYIAADGSVWIHIPASKLDPSVPRGSVALIYAASEVYNLDSMVCYKHRDLPHSIDTAITEEMAKQIPLNKIKWVA